jgi:hypothetical protein
LLEFPLGHSRSYAASRGSTVKKLLLIALAAAGAVLANRKIKAGQQEQALWAEATDNVTRSS